MYACVQPSNTIENFWGRNFEIFSSILWVTFSMYCIKVFRERESYLTWMIISGDSHSWNGVDYIQQTGAICIFGASKCTNGFSAVALEYPPSRRVLEIHRNICEALSWDWCIWDDREDTALLEAEPNLSGCTSRTCLTNLEWPVPLFSALTTSTSPEAVIWVILN